MRAIVAGLLLAVALPEAAQATSIAPLTVEQMTDASTYIVRGRVVRLWAEADADGFVWTHAELAVSDVLKGPDEPTSLEVTTLGGTLGELVTKVDGMARFSVEEDTLLFLDTINNGQDLTPVGAFTGKFTIRRPAHETRSIAVSYDVNPNTRFDARFLPVPPREQWLYADDFEAEIRAHLAAGWNGRPIAGIELEQLQRVNAPERRTH